MTFMRPISLMDGDSLPVSAFTENPDGQFVNFSAAAYEKNGTAVTVPDLGCREKTYPINQCAFVCSHATIRPFMLDDAEVKSRPSTSNLRDTKPKSWRIQIHHERISVRLYGMWRVYHCLSGWRNRNGSAGIIRQQEQPVFDYL